MPTTSDLQIQPESTTAILFDRVSVRYRIDQERSSGLKEYAVRCLQGKHKTRDFWALDDVSFSIPPGKVFGVIGRNGAGKSTLLKVIARVLSPTKGRFITRGRVAPLLELGGGFHPELTGFENVHLNGSLLGYSRKEITSFLPYIIDFSELGKFMNTPIRTYSSGMVARLGFAIATCKRPDIFLVDEVLSVGDSGFQQKCLKRMVDFHRQGTSIILVSHSLVTIQSFCESVLWLESGQVKMSGSVEDVSAAYEKFAMGGISSKTRNILEQGVQKTVSPYIDVAVDHPYFEYILKAHELRKMTGFADGTFRPDALINRQEMSVLTLRLRKRIDMVPLVTTKQLFSDIPPTHRFAKWIEAATSEGLTLSKENENFWPEQTVTRAQAAYLSLKALKGDSYQPPSAKSVYLDVPQDIWFAPWVEEATLLGLIDPSNSKAQIFGSDDPLVRAEAAKLLCVGLDLMNRELL